MKLSVLTVVLYHKTLEESLQYLNNLGVHSIELPTGGNPGKTHCDPKDYLGKPEKIQELKSLFQKYDMSICALSTHGNGIHPNPQIAREAKEDLENSILLAEQLGVDTVITFSGCAGDSDTATHSNWVTCAWPTEYAELLKWQWEEKLIPFWKEEAAFAQKHGVRKIALELHPGFMVYNTETLLRLRAAVGDTIGANFDPSHLYWQGMDPIAAARALRGAIYHVHAKDTKIDEQNTKVNGVLDTKSLADIQNRSWIFRTVGYGHSEGWWRDFISELKIGGYDGAVSIEHEDALMSPEEGLEKAIRFFFVFLICDSAEELWWV